MATPTSTCHLLNLARELRDETYRYYLDQDEGYYHNPNKNKLRQAGGKPINLLLSMLANRLGQRFAVCI
jgi:hypothetical protein